MDLIPILAKKKAGQGIYGVERLRSVSDPSFPYLIGDADLHASLPLHNQIRACKVNESRQIVNYLKPTDWTKNADESASVLDGSDGLDVMIDNPACWMILGGTDPVYERWIVCAQPFTYGADVAIEMPRFVDSPDYCTIDRTTGKSRSIRNETANFAGSGSGNTAGGLGYPRTSISRYGYETAAAAKGASWLALTYLDRLYLACMMYIEYRTKNLKVANGPGASNWSSADWNTYNGYYPVIKMFEAQLALSNTSGINTKGYMTGIYTRVFTSPAYNTQVPVYRGKNLLWGNLWAWISGIDIEMQSVADGGKTFLYVCYNNALLDANHSDASFAFKNAYTLIGELPRTDGWAKTIFPGTLYGNVNTGVGETT